MRMTRIVKQWTAFLLCGLLLCMFCACDALPDSPVSDSDSTAAEVTDPFAPSETAEAVEIDLSGAYQLEYFDVPDDCTVTASSNKDYLFYIGDTIYLSAVCKVDDTTKKSVYLRYDLNGNYLDMLDVSFISDNETIFLPKEQRTSEKAILQQTLYPLADGNYFLAVYDRGKKEARLYLLDGMGAILKESAPILPDGNQFFSCASFYLGEDYFLLYNRMDLNGFWLYDRELNLLGSFDTKEPIWDAFLRDGLPVITFQNGQCIIYNEKTNTFDAVTFREQTEAYKRSKDMLHFDDAVYLVCDEAVYVQRGGEETVLLNWTNSFLSSSSVHFLYAFPGDRFLVYYDNLLSRNNSNMDTCLLVPKESTMVSRQTVTLATVGIEQSGFAEQSILAETINHFNRTSDTYLIRQTNYDAMFAEEVYGGYTPDYEAGAKQFEEDLLAGVKYDMILFGTKYDGLSALQEKDMFMDISVAAENADLLPCLRGTESNTVLPFSMSVSTLVAADTTVSSAAEFTWETLFALYEELGDGETLFSTDVSEQLTVTMLSDYIDMDSASCTLDSPDFARAAEFISDVRKAKNSRAANPLCDGNLGSLADGATSCFGDPVGSLQSGALKFLTVNLDMLDSLISVPYLFEEAGLNPVFCGYPTKNGGTLYAVPKVQMTIPKTSANKAGAYAFLQYVLSEEVQCSRGMAARAMPVTRAAYETQIQSGYYYISSFIFEDLTAWTLEDFTEEPREQHTGLAEVHVTEEERAAMVSYFADTTARGIYDKTIRAIVDEELSAAAAGVRTTEEAGAIMKNRIWIYLNE